MCSGVVYHAAAGVEAVRIMLPVHHSDTQPTAPAAIAPVTGGDERILVVEDELAIRQFAGHTLERYGYTVRSPSTRGLAAAVRGALDAHRMWGAPSGAPAGTPTP